MENASDDEVENSKDDELEEVPGELLELEDVPSEELVELVELVELADVPEHDELLSSSGKSPVHPTTVRRGRTIAEPSQ